MRKTKETQSLVAAIDDPFERLPEHILHHILALLQSNKEAARTAVLSRTWHWAWSSYPIFDIHVPDFLPKGSDRYTVHYEPGAVQEIRDRFFKFGDKEMSRLHEHRTAISRFRVSATLIKINHSSNLLDKWIGMALYSGAQELHLDFEELDWDDSYLVPARVFSSGFIKSLSLIGRALITPLGSISIVNLSSLRFLKVFKTPLDEVMLQKLLRGCPLLEELELHCCRLLTPFVISGPNNLRRIVLIGCLSRVEIEAPSLEEFCFWKLGSARLLTDAVLLDRCTKLKHLTLCNNLITQDRFQELLSKFPLLERLKIECCQMFKKIMILNPLLKKIEIEECEGLDDIEIGSANLSRFRYGTRKMQLPLIRMQNPTAISACEAKFESSSITIPEPNSFIQLREFLTRSCTFRTLSFYLCSWEEGNVQDTSDPLPLLPYNVDWLHLFVRTPQSSHAAILNMLLSLSHPTRLRVRPYGQGCEFLKFVCEKLENTGVDDDDCYCCSGLRRKCLLHELKGVEIERITSRDGDRNILGPLDWRTLHELLPNLGVINDVYFRLHWE